MSGEEVAKSCSGRGGKCVSIEKFSDAITHLLKPNALNTLVFRAHRTDVINEPGTGGLLGPVGIYREK